MTVMLSPSWKLIQPGADVLPLIAFITVGLIDVSSLVIAANFGLSSGS